MTPKTARNLLSLLCLLPALPLAAQLPGPETETVHTIAHIKAGHEAEYARLSAQTWSTYTRLGLVLPHPHIVLRGSDEKGRPYFIEVFTWKSPDIPDHAPPQVRALWNQLEQQCEPRDGRPGIDFETVTVVDVN
jgi:hypothetical protein